MLDSIIFDLDGTLWDTCAACASGWNDIVKRQGLRYRKLSERDVRAVAGLPHDKAITTTFRGLSDEIIEVLVDETRVEDNRRASIAGRVYDGVIDLLPRLSGLLPLFIVSNCQSGYVEAFFQRSGLSPLFSDFECWGNTGRGKAENLTALVDRNGLQHPIYVGDTEGDRQAAQSSGIRFVHVSYGHGGLGIACEARFDSFPSLAAWLETQSKSAASAVSIARADPSRLPEINRLIAASKSHWPYSEEYLQQAIPLLRVTPEFVAAHPSYCAVSGSELLAFGAVELSPPEAVLEHLWVAPSRIGTGVGRRLFEHLCDLARRAACSSLRIVADPPAEGFYVRMGATRIGEIPSRVPAGPRFPLMTKILEAARP